MKDGTHMKKTLSVILLTAMLALSACGSDGVLSTSPSDADIYYYEF